MSVKMATNVLAFFNMLTYLYQHRATMVKWSKAVLRSRLTRFRFQGTSLIGAGICPIPFVAIFAGIPQGWYT